MAKSAENNFQSLSTDDLAPSPGLERWHQFVNDTYAVMRIRAGDRHSYKATLSRTQVGKIGFSWYKTTPSSGSFDVGQPGSWSAPIGDSFLLAILESGTASSCYQGREIESKPGDMILLDICQSWTISNDTVIEVVVLKIPSELMFNYVENPEAACGINMGTGDPVISLASSMLLDIKRAIEADPLADWSLYEKTILSVIATTINRLPEAKQKQDRFRTSRRKACAHIERNLDQPELSVGSIAKELNMSTRSVQRLFNDIGYTPRGYILERRLNVAAERLRHSDYRRMSITDIAFSLGFVDLTHFDRCFRRKWNTSPSNYRINHNDFN